MYYKLDSATGTAPSVIGKDANGYWHVYQTPSGASGSYQLPYNGNSTDYLGGDTAYHTLPFRSLTTTGSSGAATLTGGVLNIPTLHGLSGLYGFNSIPYSTSSTSISSSGNAILDNNGFARFAALFPGLIAFDGYNPFSLSITDKGMYIVPYYNLAGDSTTQIALATSSVPSDGDKLVVWNNTGRAQFNKYGSGTFTGTPSKQLSVTSTGDIIETNQPIITSGTSAPSSTPGKVGDIYVDTSAKKLYFATGASSSSDWTIAN